MKSKAHSKKCMEMGVAIGVIEDQDTEDSGSTDKCTIITVGKIKKSSAKTFVKQLYNTSLSI